MDVIDAFINIHLIMTSAFKKNLINKGISHLFPCKRKKKILQAVFIAGMACNVKAKNVLFMQLF